MCLFIPMINGIVIVKIHPSATYDPISTCAFLRNASIPIDASIQSCIWECVHEKDCQTAVYFNDRHICSLFIESCRSDGIRSSGSVSTSVICYPKNHSYTLLSSITSKDIFSFQNLLLSALQLLHQSKQKMERLKFL